MAPCPWIKTTCSGPSPAVITLTLVAFSDRIGLAEAPLIAFTVAAVLILGLGIGANTGIFTILNAVLFRPPVGVTEPEYVEVAG